MPTIVSTATCSTEFCDWKLSPGGLPIKGNNRVLINGGAGVMRKRGLITPLGVTTIVTLAELDFLKTHQQFNDMVTMGYLKVVADKKLDGDAVSKDMNNRDPASPLMPQDFVDRPAPKNMATAQAELPPGSKPEKIKA